MFRFFNISRKWGYQLLLAIIFPVFMVMAIQTISAQTSDDSQKRRIIVLQPYEGDPIECVVDNGMSIVFDDENININSSSATYSHSLNNLESWSYKIGVYSGVKNNLTTGMFSLSNNILEVSGMEGETVRIVSISGECLYNRAMPESFALDISSFGENIFIITIGNYSFKCIKQQ